jgi:hypothetical protein
MATNSSYSFLYNYKLVLNMKRMVRFCKSNLLLAVMLIVFLTSLGCNVRQQCGIKDTSSRIVVVPEAMSMRTVNCDEPPDGATPEEYDGPWNSLSSQNDATHATFFFRLPCTNPDCGNGGIIFREFYSGTSATMVGSTAIMTEVFNATSIAGFTITNITYESSCSTTPCSDCEPFGSFNDTWIINQFQSTIITNFDAINIDAQMQFTPLGCNC